MPWCPKCRNEFREGIAVCSDCGAYLVNELPQEEKEDRVGLFTVDELRMKGYSLKNGMTRIEPLDGADGEITSFMEEDEEALAELLDEESLYQAMNPEKKGYYYDSASQAENNRSSGWVLLFVGSLGLVFAVLALVGVIPLRLGNPYLFYGVLIAIFLLFVIMGIVSLRNAKIFEKKAKTEHSLEESLKSWVSLHLTGEQLDAELAFDDQISEEEKYYQRCQLLCSKLNHQFVNLDPAFVDNLIDSCLYDSLFSEKSL